MPSERAMPGRLIDGWVRLRRQHWLTLTAALLIVYFTYHGINGSRGLVAWHQYGEEIEASRQQLAALKAERSGLEHKVERLRYGSLDADLLDEVARRTLSLVDPLDVIILIDPESPPRD